MKKFFLLPLAVLFFVAAVPNVFADFWEMHVVDSEQAMSMAPQSEFKITVNKYPDQFFACNAGTDATVLWYLKENTRDNYINSHLRSAYINCWAEAPKIAAKWSLPVEQLEACCIGIGAHHTQDAMVSHGYGNVEGYTPACIERYWGSNLLLHAACENAMTEQVLNSMTASERARITLFAGNVYDTLDDVYPDVEGYQNPYGELLANSFFTGDAESVKQNFYEAIAIVGGFVKEGQGSGYLSIYENNREDVLLSVITKNGLLFTVIVFLIFTFFLPLYGVYAALRYGRNNLKWALLWMCLILVGLSIFVIISFISGLAFAWFRSFASFLPTIIYSATFLISVAGIFVGFKSPNKKLKYVAVAVFTSLAVFSAYVLATTNFGVIQIPDWEQHRARGVAETEKFLNTEILFPFDASGLGEDSHLLRAQTGFSFMQWAIVAAFALFVFLLATQMRRPK